LSPLPIALAWDTQTLKTLLTPKPHDCHLLSSTTVSLYISTIIDKPDLLG
jgi:hypothetical protein